MWAAEVVKLGLAVMWTEMDINLFANPLKYLYDTLPAPFDLAVEPGYW